MSTPNLGVDGNSIPYPQYLNSAGDAYEAIKGANNALNVNAVSNAGDVAHDAADSGNPTKIGFYGKATAPTAVNADGDRVNGWADLYGRQVVTSDQTFGTHDSAKPAKGVVVQAVCQSTADTPDNGDAADLSVTTGNELRVILESASAAPDAAAPTNAVQVGAVANAVADTPDEGDIGALSMDLNSNLRTTNDLVQAAPDAAAPSYGVMVGATANAAAVSVDEGDFVALSTDLEGNLRVTSGEATGASDAAAPTNTMQVGALANAAAPSVDEGDLCALSTDLAGNLRTMDVNTQGTHDSAAPTYGSVVQAVCQATADTPDDGDAANFSMTTGNELRTVLESSSAVSGAAMPTNILGVGGEAHAENDTAVDDGDVAGIGIDLNGNVKAVGNMAHDSVDAGNPIKIGGKASTSTPSGVSNGDRVNAYFDANGRQVVSMDEVMAASDAAAPTKTVQIGGVGNATANTIDEGDLGALSMDLNSNLRTINGLAQAALDAAAPAQGVMAGAYGTAAENAVDEGDLAALSTDLNSNLRVSAIPREKSVTLSSSSEKTESANGTAVTGLGGYGYAEIVFDVTAAATAVDDTLDMYIDASPDGGTTWVNVVHFTQVLGNGGAKKFFAIVNTKGATGTAIFDASADLTTAPDIRHYLGNAMRARWAITDAGDDNAAFTFAVTANLKS